MPKTKTLLVMGAVALGVTILYVERNKIVDKVKSFF